MTGKETTLRDENAEFTGGAMGENAAIADYADSSMEMMQTDLRNRTSKIPPIAIEELREVLHNLEIKESQGLALCLRTTPLAGSTHDSSKAQLSQWFSQDQDGDNTLMLAIIHKREDIVDYILDHVTHPKFMNIQNKLGQTCLHLAVAMDMPRTVRRLVAWGGNVTRQDNHGNTPLHLACKHGYWDCVVSLSSPLTYQEVVNRQYHIPYLRIPQNMNIRNYEGFTCLRLAANGSHFQIMQHLVSKCDADINAFDWRSGETLLHSAVQEVNMELLMFLLAHRSLNLNAVRYDGLTPVDIASLTNSWGIVNMLLKAGGQMGHGFTTRNDDLDLTSESCYDDIKIGGMDISDC